MIKNLVLFIFLFMPICANAEMLEIQGAGPSALVVRAFLPLIGGGVSPTNSIKHAGGLEWSDIYLFGRTGRPCTGEELEGRAEIFLARVPLVFGVPKHIGIESISYQQLEDIYTKKIKKWSEINKNIDLPILTIGREPTEAMLGFLIKDYPIFDKVTFDVIRTKDNLVTMTLIQGNFNGKGYIGFGAKPNFSSKSLIRLKIKDMKEIGVPVGLVYNLKNAQNPLVIKAQEMARSEEWNKKVKALGLLPY
jgi:ABC-type phosphate transport system substrate-binding protein